MSPEQEISLYESELAARIGVEHVVATSSGTTALHTALYAAGVGPGDEVLVPALTVVMTAAPVVALGARPVVVDSDPAGTGLDHDDVLSKIGPRTRAVLPVLLWGRADPWAQRLRALAADHGLAVIVDAAQALGTTWTDGQAGVPAHAVCFSTHSSKILATGEGGFLGTDDPQLAARARAYRSHWLPPPPGEAPLARAAHNFRLAAPLAEIGRRRLTHLDELVARRRARTASLDRLLADAPALRAVPADDGWNGYAPLYRLDLARPRAFCEHLAACGVANSTGTFGLVPLDQRPAYTDLRHAPCRQAAAVLDATLALALPNTPDVPHIRDDADALDGPAAADLRQLADTITREAARWAV
ncbi:DegT/DnrJ/EryC1/StrS family aminotransferase [Pseudonocardia sp. HH130630-07]|uniref:DegT/DnrJ/EryC1/StrS family aminotransferase n=1 Tax=Pseudonocardia sp. HH130630-07 TaxID=1690815 RepID=UPI000814DE59|nr:DegT/DnrJ/EryC1/StrS family aminotransferase [Pseudonocardia sp. HH130630-07]ANY07782.1 hypothetical protein AFB00_17435 [Pseudonocardia sp. HH130630-07]